MIPALDYTQHQQSLVISDPATPNRVAWRLFRSVLTVNQGDDAGDGVCDATCTLRDAILTATTSPPPILINFDHLALSNDQGVATIEITHNAPLRVQAADTRIDGRDASGNPSPLVDFPARIYPLTVTLVAENAAPDPLQTCPCNESGRRGRAHSGHGRARGRRGAPAPARHGGNDLLRRRGSRRVRPRQPEQCGHRLSVGRWGARDHDCRRVTGRDGAGQWQGLRGCGRHRAHRRRARVVENSELRYCYDRGVKSQQGYLRLERNWIHHNLRGGVFAQSPTDDGNDAGVAYSRSRT